MDLDDKELFSSAMTDDQNPETETEAQAEAPAQETPQQERQRDEQGRFAKQVEPEPKPEPEQAEPAKEEANVPSWRLREVREEAERRVAETNAQWQRQFAMLQRQNAPKPEPVPAPDLFENPQGAIEYGARQLLTPIEQRLQAMHKRMSVMQQIDSAGDLDKWVMQRAAELQQRGQQPQQGNGRQASNGSSQGNSIVKLPPSMRNLPASQVDGDDDSDMSDAAMFRQAMR